ncbi:hypothetical protein DQ384_05315 [Sphaerisporangium album]|uniref:Uncharacterized protein n=1 Tax=Sphaerisporangium album TaxID=509200 RepID=A0A367FNI8_9ACTN|nr:hypothetical protein [Sphaerisporangium album]RCG31963.1 hypothetical protein DQ384_05315 [Sphaerisporangium album]
MFRRGLARLLRAAADALHPNPPVAHYDLTGRRMDLLIIDDLPSQDFAAGWPILDRLSRPPAKEEPL